MIKNLPKVYRQDKWINELYKVDFSDLKTRNTNNYNNLFFTKLDDYGCSTYERDLEIAVNNEQTLDSRRRSIINKWRASHRCTLPVIQNMCDTYFDNYVTAKYDGDAELHFYARVGFLKHISDDIKTRFETALNEIKPAHFIYDWVQDKNKWVDYYTNMNWGGAKDKYNWDVGITWGSAKNSDVIGKSWEYMKTRSWDDTLNLEIEY